MTETQPEARSTLFTWGLVVLAGCILALAELPFHLVHEYEQWDSAGHPGLPDVSIGLSAGIMAASLVTMPLTGVLTDWIGVRRTVLTGLSLGGAGLAFFSLTQSAWALYPAYFLTTVGVGMGGWVPVMVGVCRRFHRRRAIAIGLANTVGEFGKWIPYVALIALFAWSTSPNDGWVSWNRLTVSLGLAFVAIALSGYAALTLRGRDAALLTSSRTGNETEAGSPATPTGADFTARQALRTRAFRLIAAGNAAAAMAAGSATFFFALMMTERGYSAASAASALAFYSLTLFCSTLVAGFVGNRYSLQLGLATFIGVQTAGLAFLAIGDSLALTYLALAALGIGTGGRITLSVAILANYFGTSSLGKILSWSEMLLILATTAGLPLSGLALDWQVGYTALLLILTGMSLLSALCFLGARHPSTPLRSPCQ